jgi:hypothetical protein
LSHHCGFPSVPSHIPHAWLGQGARAARIRIRTTKQDQGPAPCRISVLPLFKTLHSAAHLRISQAVKLCEFTPPFSRPRAGPPGCRPGPHAPDSALAVAPPAASAVSLARPPLHRRESERRSQTVYEESTCMKNQHAIEPLVGARDRRDLHQIITGSSPYLLLVSVRDSESHPRGQSSSSHT